MAKIVDRSHALRDVFDAMPHLKRFPSNHFWVDYDEEADVLYISFDRPQRATNSVLRDDNVLLRYRGKKLVGITMVGTKAHRLRVS